MKRLIEKIWLYILGISLWIKERLIFFALGTIFFFMGVIACDFSYGNASFTRAVISVIVCGSLALTLIKLHLREGE